MMEGHEDAPVVAELEPTDLAKAAEQAFVDRAAGAAVSALEPVLLDLGERVGSLAARLDELAGSLAAAPTDETRLESLEARIAAFGKGGTRVGDALALAEHALACCRVLAETIQRGTGLQVPLPAAPGEAAAAATVVGAELAGSLG